MRVAFSSDCCNSNATPMQPYKTVSLLFILGLVYAIWTHGLIKRRRRFFNNMAASGRRGVCAAGRPGVRIASLRPNKESLTLLRALFYYVEVEKNLILNYNIHIKIRFKENKTYEAF